MFEKSTCYRLCFQGRVRQHHFSPIKLTSPKFLHHAPLWSLQSDLFHDCSCNQHFQTVDSKIYAFNLTVKIVFHIPDSYFHLMDDHLQNISWQAKMLSPKLSFSLYPVQSFLSSQFLCINITGNTYPPAQVETSE